MKCLLLWIVTVAVTCVRGQNLGLDHQSIGTCDQPWTPTYAHNYMGAYVVGSLANLQDHITKGYLVRVQFSTTEWLITFGLDDFTFRGRHVCGGSAWFLSDNGTHIESEPDWLPTLVCTTGAVRRINYTASAWTRSVGVQDLALDGEVWWYTKPTSCDEKPIYSQFVDGSTASGDLKRLLKTVKWSELRVNMRDRGFSFVVSNQKIYNNELLTAQSLDHISQSYTQDSVKFNEQPYYNWLSVWSTNGRRDVSRWFLENTTLYKHNNDFVSLDWYGDECWRRVFSTDIDGFVTYGDLSELIHMIQIGHKVRVHFNGYTFRTNGIRVVGDLVVAQTIEEYERRGNYPAYDAPFFNTNAMAVYRLVHSSGMVKTYKYTIEDFVQRDTPQSRYPIDWLVDRRQWKKVLRTDASGQTTFGIQRDLEDTVASGASVRLNIEQDELAGQFYTEVDNVRINFYTNEIYAQAMKHVSDQKLQTLNEYSLQDNIFQWSLMVSSSGVVAMNARRLGSRENLYDAVSPATNVTWFVNI